MVGFKHKGWLPEIASSKKDHHARRRCADESKKKAPRLRILAFETAKSMSRLISLYKSLSDGQISRLKNRIIKSKGISYLTSTDEEFLLSLACGERTEDLDHAAAVVSRLGKKCGDPWLNQFDLVYTDLKLGVLDFGKLEYGSRYAEKRVRKMEKLVSATASLHAALAALAEMEAAERKMKRRNKQMELDANSDLFNQKLEIQRKDVKYLKETSLWRKSCDKCVSIMATIVIIVYIRICSVFKPYITILPSISLLNVACFQQQRDLELIEKIKQQLVEHPSHVNTEFKPNKIRLYRRKSGIFFNDWDAFETDGEKFIKNNRVFHSAGPSTLGGSGLALHYANVILLVEKYLDSSSSIGRDEREALYQMLPENLKALVRVKLSKNMRCSGDDAFLAEGWRAATVEIMGWLAPMAEDMVRWQMERHVDKLKFDTKPSVLLLQTLHFCDKEKTEAAIAEVLVALSCVYRFENRSIYGE
ncbi:protein PSK SIMULATOR 2-like [Salvia miltiorrhiza]|uniref:protein PSK SIMULATOR 2-like n=1 Tax=Salvia miltiorrhiza TaxID=226208 RepID=UPI0025AD037D|nr:protein PSK SIMULATOR 2-like [Salvia miltiorrhiza]